MSQWLEAGTLGGGTHLDGSGPARRTGFSSGAWSGFGGSSKELSESDAAGWALAFGLADARVLQASTAGSFPDTDGDLLPDSLEWVLCTDPLAADSDGDGSFDFVEAVHYSFALDNRDAPALDHGMRPVVTTERGSNGGSRVWIHLLFQFVGVPSPVGVVQQFSPWVDLGAGRLPFDLLGSGIPLLRLQPLPDGSTLVMLSTDVGPLGNFTAARFPVTVGADALLGTKAVSSGVHLNVAQGELISMTPNLFYTKPDLFAVRSTQSPRNKPNPFQNANKVCVMDIQAIGSGPAGVIYEVSDARCQTAQGLNCGPECSQMMGWTFTLPSGAPAITGG